MEKIDKNTIFQTADHKETTLEKMLEKIEDFYLKEPEFEYKLSIGSDSMTHDDTTFVLAIVIHRVGNGGIYFYKKMNHDRIVDLRSKLYEETTLSLSFTETLIENFLDKNPELYEKLHLSIHIDIGQNGPTKSLIKELEGWVNALGYDCEITPESYAASTTANIHSQ